MTIQDETLNEVVGGQPNTNNATPGMKCPACQNWIPTTIYQIVTAAALVCPHCHLRINIDKTESRKAIDALRKVKEAQEKVKQ